MPRLLNIIEIKELYPEEWVLLGNPVKENNNVDVIFGIPIYHSKDKKEVCYMGRDKTAPFDKVTLIFTGSLKSTRKITGLI